jgi:glutathione S-transferase
MIMKIFTNPASPFCRKVDVVLLETDQRGDVTDVPAVGHPAATENMPTDVNPIGKIPVLQLEDGKALYDSRVICRFLDNRAGAGLFPEQGLWDVLTLEALGDGIADAAVLMVYEARVRPEDMIYAPWVEGQWAKVARALDALETDWQKTLNDPLNIGQIAVAAALGYLDFRHADRNWRDGHKALATWYEGFADRPSMQATNPG